MKWKILSLRPTSARTRRRRRDAVPVTGNTLHRATPLARVTREFNILPQQSHTTPQARRLGRRAGGTAAASVPSRTAATRILAARGRCNTSLLPHHRQQNWTSPRAAGSRVNATGRNGSHYIGRGQSKTPGHSPTTGNNLACPRRWRFEASRSGTPASPPCPSARGSESLLLNKSLTVAHGRDLK